MTAEWDHARAVADAVLYEGYLLYPYRATRARTNPAGSSVCWGRRAPRTPASARMTRCPRRCWCGPAACPSLSVVVRFLQLQHRGAERDVGGGRFEQVDELTTGSHHWLSWDEAVEREITIGPFRVDESAAHA